MPLWRSKPDAAPGSPDKARKEAPGWVVTFGDMMSLLLTFFVLLFTYSTLDAEKYKALAGSLKAACGATMMDQFAGLSARTLDANTVAVPVPVAPAEVGTASSADAPPTMPGSEAPQATMKIEDAPEHAVLESYAAVMQKRARDLETELKAAVSRELDGARIEVSRRDDKVLIRFPSEIAFPFGSAEITPAFANVLENLRPMLRGAPGDIVVSGHTDDVPINGGRFRSNWELSAARATSVVHVLAVTDGVDPTRLTVQGFGESQPLAANDSPSNRACNRRVEIRIDLNRPPPSP